MIYKYIRETLKNNARYTHTRLTSCRTEKVVVFLKFVRIPKLPGTRFKNLLTW